MDATLRAALDANKRLAAEWRQSYHNLRIENANLIGRNNGLQAENVELRRALQQIVDEAPVNSPSYETARKALKE